MPTTLLLDKEEMTRILERLACEVLERHGQCERVMLVGIERRGADLARRLGALMQQKLQRPLPWARWTSTCTVTTGPAWKASPTSASRASPPRWTTRRSSL